MGEKTFNLAIITVAVVFTLIFCFVVVPPLLEDPDIVAAFAAGFVNPFSSGYSADVISCWIILAIWVFYESTSMSINHGWVCLLLGIVPGVAVGFALYLLLRSKQLAARAGTNDMQGNSAR